MSMPIYAACTGVLAGGCSDVSHTDQREVLDGMSFSKAIYRKACDDSLEFRGHIQHPVGMSVHDVARHRDRP